MNQLYRNFIYLAAAAFVAACSVNPTPESVTGQYRAVLDSPGGELAFPIHVQSQGDSLSAFVVNAVDTVSFNDVRLKNDSLIMGFDYYNSYLRAEVQYGGSLSGKWFRLDEGGDYVSMEFNAQKGTTYRYRPTSPEGYPFEGQWQATFTEGEKTFPAQGEFMSQPGGKLYGTFRKETGDYRYLEGVYTDSTFTLSTFDGPHAYLFKAELQPDGTLEGDFWSANTTHATWTARKGESQLRDPLQVSDQEAIGNQVTFAFPDLQGDTVSISDARFRDKPLLIYLFGSWCPNCADETRMLRKIYRETYHQTDLQIVGLAFEYTGNYKKDVETVNRYKKRFDIPWKLLIAGTSDKERAAERLPFLDQIHSFPTSIFVNRNHTIEAIHVGFNGPATGSSYYREIQRFKQQINEIL